MKRLRSLTIQAVRGKPGEYPSFAAELATIIRHNPECVISVDRLTITTGFESLANAFMSLKEIEFCGHDHSSEGVRYVGNAQSVVSKATECQQLTILKCMAFDKVAAVGISQLEGEIPPQYTATHTLTLIRNREAPARAEGSRHRPRVSDSP